MLNLFITWWAKLFKFFLLSVKVDSVTWVLPCLIFIISLVLKTFQALRKLWSSGRALGSQLEGCEFDPCPMLNGSGVKAFQD